MLQHLLIRDFAIIENTEIEFEDGLNVITGETGSGKSIVIEAVSLALGSRADSSFVRNGKSKAIIQLAATFEGEEYIITREISANGKNLCRLNGQLVTLGEISALARRLADIHGQYDNQALLDPDQHLVLVDRYQGDVIRPLNETFQEAYQAYKRSRGRLEELRTSIKESRKQADFYRFALNEIEAATLEPGEDEELTERIQILQNSEKIFSAVEGSHAILEGDSEESSGVIAALGQVQNHLATIAGYSKEIQRISDSIADALYTLSDGAQSLSALREQTVFSPSELDQAITRLDYVESLKNKYGGDDNTIEAVLAYGEELSQELDQVENFDALQAEYEKDAKEKLAVLKECSASLTKAREESAASLSVAIERELKDLRFEDAKIQIQVIPAGAITSSGADAIDFLISTNKGESLKPLIKIASGGEISRIMLAIKNITGEDDHIPTMIFDEIDAGISGITASVVGRKLKEIAQNHQVICITHLPQIAASGTSHYRIFKETDDSSTFTHVDRLSQEQTVDEIARLLGGEVITETTRASAKELLAGSK